MKRLFKGLAITAAVGLAALAARDAAPLLAQSLPTVTLSQDAVDYGQQLDVTLDLSTLIEGDQWAVNVHSDPTTVVTECNGPGMGQTMTMPAALISSSMVSVSNTCPVGTGYTVRLQVTLLSGTFLTLISDEFFIHAPPTAVTGALRVVTGAANAAYLDLSSLAAGDTWSLNVLSASPGAKKEEVASCEGDDPAWSSEQTTPAAGYELVVGPDGGVETYTHKIRSSPDCPSGLYLYELSYTSGAQIHRLIGDAVEFHS